MQNIDPQTQALLNKPLQSTQGLAGVESDFLDMILKKILDGSINLYRPGSLLNADVLSSLSLEAQLKADMDASNILAAIREIKNLQDAGLRDTYQMQYTVRRLRETKERLEHIGGDIFII